ncbi:MAG: hypothetical protein ACRENK_09935 [Gemmatimonadaceae bacterium]
MSKQSCTRHRVLSVLFVALLACLPVGAVGQVQLVWSDGSKYLTGTADMQAYYLYVPGGGNGSFDHPQTCQNYATYITVVNQTARTLDFYANVEVGINDACSSVREFPVRGSVAPHSSLRVRATPDFWVVVGSRLGSPGISFTDVSYRGGTGSDNQVSQNWSEWRDLSNIPQFEFRSKYSGEGHWLFEIRNPSATNVVGYEYAVACERDEVAEWHPGKITNGGQVDQRAFVCPSGKTIWVRVRGAGATLVDNRSGRPSPSDEERERARRDSVSASQQREHARELAARDSIENARKLAAAEWREKQDSATRARNEREREREEAVASARSQQVAANAQAADQVQRMLRQLLSKQSDDQSTPGSGSSGSDDDSKTPFEKVFGDETFNRANIEFQRGQNLLLASVRNHNCSNARDAQSLIEKAVTDYEAVTGTNQGSAAMQLSFVRNYANIAQRQVQINCR